MNKFVDPLGIGRLKKYVATLLIFSLVLAVAPGFQAQAAPEAASIDWMPVGGQLKQISTDESFVWGLQPNDSIWRRPVDGSGKWEQVAGSLSSISASGKGWIWGSNSSNKIYKCAKPCAADGSGWQLVEGDAKQVSAGEASVWAIHPTETIWRMRVDGSGAWEQVAGSLRTVSASGNGWIWGANSANSIYKCAKPCAADGSGWQLVDGAAKQVWADQLAAWAVHPTDSVWRRPVDGSGMWQSVPRRLTNIASSSTGWLWAVNSANSIFKAQTSDLPAPSSVARVTEAPTPKPKPESRPESKPILESQSRPQSPAVTAAKPNTDDSNGLIGLWRFEGDAKDASANGNDGRFVNGAALGADTPSGVGQSLRIGGGTQHVLVPHSDSLNVKTGLTIAAWVKPVDPVGFDGIVAKNPSEGSRGTQAGNYELRIDEGSHKLSFLYQRGGANDTVGHSSSAVIGDGVWTHVAVTVRPGGALSYFVNGKLVGTDPRPIESGFGATNTSPLYIGTRANMGTTFNGFIDDVAIFDRPLQRPGIAAIASGDFSRFGVRGGENLIAQQPTKPDPPRPESQQIIQGTVVITPQPKPAEQPPQVVVVPASDIIIGDVYINPPKDPNPQPVVSTPEPVASNPQLGGTLVIATYGDPLVILDTSNFPSGLAGNFDLNAPQYFVDEDMFCWRDNYGRVSLPTKCEGGQYEVGFCYPECKEGYHRHLTICYEDCPEGFEDDLALCRRPPHTIAKLSYGNTAGIPLICPPGKVEGAGLCYDQCPAGYYGIAGICWEDSCPEGYNNDPLTCRRDPSTIGKDSFDRGFGTSMVCGEGYEQIGALCYPVCRPGFNGELDWCRKPCPAGYHDDGVTCSIPPHATTADNSQCPWYDKCCIALGRDQGYRSHCPDGYRNDGCTCFRDAKIVSQEMYYRGQIPFNACPKNMDRDGGGALCYPNCREGYQGNGPRCWQVGCPEGYDNHPATCFKGAHIYGKQSQPRGGGTLPNSCPAGYEKDPGGALCYPTCKEGFHMVGPVCWRNDQAVAAVEKCPEGYRDDGLLCTRDMYVFGPNSYNTGVGTFPSCADGTTMSGGLCYKECKEGFNAVGPVCWQTCPVTAPLEFGAACAGSDQAIAKGWGSMFMAAWDVLMNAITFGAYAFAKQAAYKAGTQVPATLLQQFGKWAINKTKELPGKLKGSLDNIAKDVSKGIVKGADEAIDTAIDSADNGGKIAKDVLDAAKAEAKDAAKAARAAEARKIFLEKVNAATTEAVGPAPTKGVNETDAAFKIRDLDYWEAFSKEKLAQSAIQGRKDKTLLQVTQGLAAIGEAKAVLADPAGEAIKFVEESAHGSEPGLAALSMLDVTGLYGLVESFIHPTCEILPPNAQAARPLMAPVTQYSGSLFGRGADSEIQFSLSSPVETISRRGESAPTEAKITSTDFWLPPDVRFECSSPDGTLVPIGQADALNVGAGPAITSSAPDRFPLGVTTVVWTSTGEDGESSQGKQRVTVVDTTPPMILAAAAEYTVECSSPEGTSFAQTASAADMCDGPVEVTSDAPELLPLGTTVVHWDAVDKAGNANRVSQTIRVVDTTPPWLSCQEQVYAYAPSAEGTEVVFPLVATDNCSVVDAVTCSAASGSKFPVGATPVKCQAVDGAGLTATCSFQVNVLPPQAETRDAEEE